MKFYIKPKHFAQHRSFKIRDESQGELFKIKGKFFLGLRFLSMKDMNNQTLYTIKRRFRLSFYRNYSVMNAKGEEVANVHRTFGRARPMYTVLMKDRRMHFEGAVPEHAFSLHDSDGALAKIEKKSFDFGDAYEIDVITENDPLLHLFLVLCIDQMNHERKKFRS